MWRGTNRQPSRMAATEGWHTIMRSANCSTRFAAGELIVCLAASRLAGQAGYQQIARKRNTPGPLIDSSLVVTLAARWWASAPAQVCSPPSQPRLKILSAPGLILGLCPGGTLTLNVCATLGRRRRSPIRQVAMVPDTIDYAERHDCRAGRAPWCRVSRSRCRVIRKLANPHMAYSRSASAGAASAGN